jgi:hypothetical protein
MAHGKVTHKSLAQPHQRSEARKRRTIAPAWGVERLPGTEKRIEKG